MRCYCCVLLHVLISVVCAELLLSGEGKRRWLVLLLLRAAVEVLGFGDSVTLLKVWLCVVTSGNNKQQGSSF